MGIIRKLRNRFFPPSWNTVNRYYEALEKEIKELHRLTEELRTERELLIQDTNKQIDALKEQNEKILGLVHAQMDNDKPANRIFFWENAYEKEAIKNNYGAVTEDPDFENKYLALIRGLDEESIRTINRVLWKQSQYLSDTSTRLDLFTYEEQEELRVIEDTFKKEVVKISENLYAFGKYLLPIDHFEPVVFYYKYCLSELKHLDRIKGKTIIDAGAFIGDTALIFSELEQDRIISFEPVYENYELCQRTIRLNGLTNVTLEQKALGDKQGFIDIYYAGEGSTIYPRDEDNVFYKGKSSVPVITLDQYVHDNKLQVGLIKMDIEGSEPDCLKGARQIITEQKPTMLICIYHNKHDFFEIKTMIESWDLGYGFKVRKPTVPNATYETLLIAEPD